MTIVNTSKANLILLLDVKQYTVYCMFRYFYLKFKHNHLI